jgi:hypothetical protein
MPVDRASAVEGNLMGIVTLTDCFATPSGKANADSFEKRRCNPVITGGKGLQACQYGQFIDPRLTS